ncbi:hypothetical protein [Roseivivax sp. CAU 1761]
MAKPSFARRSMPGSRMPGHGQRDQRAAAPGVVDLGIDRAVMDQVGRVAEHDLECVSADHVAHGEADEMRRAARRTGGLRRSTPSAG